MIQRPSWRMREEGEMLAFVAECPECHSPASGVVSSQLLQSPLQDLPEAFCSKCRKRFRTGAKDLCVLSVNARRCR
jgi:transcriptional regulator NrdR family protein